MKLRVIKGGRKRLENRVIRNMMRGRLCQEELERLRPWGKLHLVDSPKPNNHSEPKSTRGHTGS